MGILDIFGWEDIRKQPSYKAGEKARDFADNPQTTQTFVKEYVRTEYQKQDKVNRDLFRRGWCRE